MALWKNDLKRCFFYFFWLINIDERNKTAVFDQYMKIAFYNDLIIRWSQSFIPYSFFLSLSSVIFDCYINEVDVSFRFSQRFDGLWLESYQTATLLRSMRGRLQKSWSKQCSCQSLRQCLFTLVFFGSKTTEWFEIKIKQQRD